MESCVPAISGASVTFVILISLKTTIIYEVCESRCIDPGSCCNTFFPACNKQFDKRPAVAQEDNSAALNLAAGKPNIVLIIGDDVGREMPTYNGGESYSTPNLDMMASGGMQFPYFFSHPDGPPSRIAMVTGRYNFRNWVELGVLADTEKPSATC